MSGRAINRGAFHVNEAALRGAQVTNRTGFTPTRQSFVGAAAVRGNVARPPSAIQNRTVVARTSPAAGASHLPVRTFAGANNQAGRGGFSGGVGARGPAIGRTAETGAAGNKNRPPAVQGRPQSQMRSSPVDSGINRNQPNSGRPSRNWSAQGNTTDRGQAPAGFGSNSGNTNRSDRPSWAGSGNNRSGDSVNPRPSASANRPNSGNRASSNPDPARGYAQQRSYNPPSRNNSQPPQSQQRTYSAPQRGYPGQSAPSRSYSPPSQPSGPSRSSGPPGSSQSNGGSRAGANSSNHSNGSPHGRH